MFHDPRIWPRAMQGPPGEKKTAKNSFSTPEWAGMDAWFGFFTTMPCMESSTDSHSVLDKVPIRTQCGPLAGKFSLQNRKSLPFGNWKKRKIDENRNARYNNYVNFCLWWKPRIHSAVENRVWMTYFPPVNPWIMKHLLQRFRRQREREAQEDSMSVATTAEP